MNDNSEFDKFNKDRWYPYLVHRAMAAIYVRIPVLFNTPVRKKGPPALYITDIPEDEIRNYDENHTGGLHERLMHLTRLYLDFANDFKNSNFHVCLVEGKQKAFFFHEQTYFESENIPRGTGIQDPDNNRGFPYASYLAWGGAADYMYRNFVLKFPVMSYDKIMSIDRINYHSEKKLPEPEIGVWQPVCQGTVSKLDSYTDDSICITVYMLEGDPKEFEVMARQFANVWKRTYNVLSGAKYYQVTIQKPNDIISVFTGNFDKEVINA